jgi:hypothetical protein
MTANRDSEVALLRAENDALREEVASLRDEIEALRFEADLDACHVAGLAAQLKAIIAEGDACPSKVSHPLLERVAYTNQRTGEPMTKTKSYPLYRAAFDAEAEERGIAEPQAHRA